MNDRYLFKAKRIDNGEWAVGSLLTIAKINSFICTGKIKLDGALKGHIYPEMYAVDESTICQCANLKDESGKLIYENDIVGFGDTTYTESGYSEAGCIGKVVWDNATASFQVTNRLMAESYEVLDEGCVVCGNVFDNPELLEVE